MNIRKSLVIGLCALGFAGLAAPSMAKADVDVFFSFAPPPLRHEVIPLPRAGFVWSGGYWDVRDRRHVWRQGHWERARRGYHYAAPQWVRHGHRWELQRGRWQSERNYRNVGRRYDENGYNHNRGGYGRDRYGGYGRGGYGDRGYGDRDRDRVPNRYDDAPRNPRRH